MANKFILAHYGVLTPGEVSLAFTLNAAGDLPEKIELFGPNLTIEHLGKVLIQYIRKRANLAQKLNEQRQNQLQAPPPSKEQQDMEDKQFVNEYYRKYLNNDFSTVTLEYAYMVYDSLDNRGMMQLPLSKKLDYMKEAQAIRDREISAPAITYQERKEQNGLIEMYLNDAVPFEEAERVRRYAKRLALMDLFKVWKEAGKTKIFEL